MIVLCHGVVASVYGSVHRYSLGMFCILIYSHFHQTVLNISVWKPWCLKKGFTQAQGCLDSTQSALRDLICVILLL